MDSGFAQTPPNRHTRHWTRPRRITSSFSARSPVLRDLGRPVVTLPFSLCSSPSHVGTSFGLGNEKGL